MTAGARFSVFALLAVFVIGWGLVATTPTPQPRASLRTEPVPVPVPVPAPEPEPEPETEPEPEPESEHESEPAPEPAPVAPPPAAPDPAAAEDLEHGEAPEARDPVAEAYADRERVIERNVVRYDDARDRFVDEPRDEAWAAERERTLQAVATEAGIGDLVESVECKSSLCQLRMRFNGLTASGAAVRLGSLAQAIGPERVLRNEGPPDQRTMVIYLPRDGQWPDGSGAGPALDGK